MKRLLGVLLTTAALAMAADQLPFVAVFTSSVPAGPPGGPCNNGSGVLISVQGAGYATYLGQFKATQTYCASMDGTSFADGQFTLTFVNGDTMAGRSSGFLEQSGSTATIWGAFLIVGGTGRFAGTAGGGSATGTLNLVTGVASDFVMVGKVSRPIH
jgi:hypothetical protein